MQFKEKILQYYSTGRYECDLDFHMHLLKVLKELNLYEWEPKLHNQTQLVKKIKELTDLSNHHNEDDYEDEEIISHTYKIKSLISSINTKDIQSIIKECQELKWESYSHKIHQRVTGKGDYEKIIERIKSTIHSEQFRIDSMLFTTLFEMVNAHEVNPLIVLYSSTIQVFLKYLTSCAKQIQSIAQAAKISNICALPKTKQYVLTNYSILRTCLRFCEIIKVLAGKNNLSLKFTVIKKEMEKLIKQHGEWKVGDEKEDIFAVLPHFKQYLKNKCPFDKSQVCKWCFKLLKKEKNQHAFCNYIIHNKNKFTINE